MAQTLKEKIKFLFSKKIELPGYKFNNTIFKIAIFIIACLLVATALQLKDNAYFKCNEESITPCENPFYLMKICTFNNDNNCLIKYLMPGESIGTKPGPLYSLAGPLALSILALAFLINHLIYNKGVKIK